MTRKALQDRLAQPEQEPVAEVVWGAKTDFEWKFKMLVELVCAEDVPVKLYAGPFKGAASYWHDTETDKGTTPPAAAPVQPKQEPVAWMFQHGETGRMSFVSNDGMNNPELFLAMNPRYALVCALTTPPAQPAPVQEPVASVPIHPKTGPLWAMTTDKPDPERLPSYPLMRLYTTPPAAQRTWVGLTNDDLVACSDSQKATVLYFMKKLKEKNT